MASQLMTTAVLLLALAAPGLSWGAHWGSRLQLPGATALGLGLLVGLTYIGFATLIVGHLQLLGSWLPFGLAVGGLALAWPQRRAAGVLVARFRGSAQFEMRQRPVLAFILLGASLLSIAAALSPPARTDEVQYHWPAPLAWAEAGGWNASRHALTNPC